MAIPKCERCGDDVQLNTSAYVNKQNFYKVRRVTVSDSTRRIRHIQCHIGCDDDAYVEHGALARRRRTGRR